MATVSQTHRTFSGRGHLLQGDEAPIDVHYQIVLSARPITATTLDGPKETAWEWDKAEGHVRLANHADWSRVDVDLEHTLALEDGRHCPVTLNFHGHQPSTTFSVTCSPADLAPAE